MIPRVAQSDVRAALQIEAHFAIMRAGAILSNVKSTTGPSTCMYGLRHAAEGPTDIVSHFLLEAQRTTDDGRSSPGYATEDGVCIVNEVVRPYTMEIFEEFPRSFAISNSTSS